MLHNTVLKKIKLRLRASIKKHDVIIMSYDIIRNDIEELSTITWNYCILDEGHIIKNGKTKITKAIKTVKSNHRLILSGTPIQVLYFLRKLIFQMLQYSSLFFLYRIMCLNYGPFLIS